MLSFDPDGTLRSIETAEDAVGLDALERVEFYNGLLVPEEMLKDDPAWKTTLNSALNPIGEAVFDRSGRNGTEGFTVGRRQGVVLIEGIDWQRLCPTPRSTARKIL